MKRIGVLTSGGDAPGMNSAIRSVVRSALAEGCEVFGFRDGFAGLLASDGRSLSARDVGGIMQLGGTFLGSSRSLEFETEAGQQTALAGLQRMGIEGLVVIGGNGSQKGAHAISQRGLPVVGIASTIDNDLYGFDVTIGIDTALNIALEAIDRLKTTATSLERAFLVEVMGRDHGYLALMAGLAGGAEAISIPEAPVEPDAIAEQVRAAYDRGKPHAIVVVAEGAKHDGAALEAIFKDQHLGFDLRLTKLGHVQRGGAPGFADRILALRSGLEAARRLLSGEHGVVVGQSDGLIKAVPLSVVASTVKQLDLSLFEAAPILST